VPRLRPRVRRTSRGHYELRLPPGERSLLRTLPRQLRELLRTEDPALERLFPPAYADDPERNAEYVELVREDLVSQRMTSLDVMEATIDEDRLDEEQVAAWLGALNDLRLVLGTRLEVTEEMSEEGLPPGDPRGPAFELYQYLTFLESEVVDALASGLPSA
jgi:hypothetical protein